MQAALGPLIALLAMDPAPLDTRGLALRASFLEESLERAEGPARLWYFGWISAFGAGLSVRTALAFAGSTEGIRVDSQVAMVTLAAGLGMTLALAPHTLYAGGQLREAPAGDACELRAKVLWGETLLRRGAGREARGRSWLPHVAGVVVSVGAGAFLALHEERWTSGIVQAALGITVNELKIFTQPTTASDALATYERAGVKREPTSKLGSSAPASRAVAVSLSLSASPAAVALSGTF